MADTIKRRDYPRKQSRGPTNIKTTSVVPRRRQEKVKFHGWGYQDSEVYLADGVGRCTGNRYLICNIDMPNIKTYVKEKFGITLTDFITRDPVILPREDEYPATKFTKEMIETIKTLDVEVSVEGIDRLVHAQGQSVIEMCRMFQRPIKMRIPDAVVWPNCHEDVVELVKIAEELGLVIIPFGGGTSVSGALVCPENEARPIISLDLNQMNEILWIDKDNLVVCAEGGIIGQDLERELGKLGYTVGHEPDSVEFSTLGGWVATRASGMKKNTYGNIEDLVVHVRLVTPRGVLEKSSRGPRVSSGPDFNQLVLGSEGNLGVITEVCVKMRKLPQMKLYGSAVFPDFDCGVRCAREIAQRGLEPTNLRLMDNEMFQFGKCLKPSLSPMGLVLDGLKMSYLKIIKNFNLNKMAVMTLLYEGDKDVLLAHEKKLNEIVLRHKGIPAGSSNGERGYAMTFVIAYIRDIVLEFNVVCESLETSVEWAVVEPLARNLRQRVQKETLRMGSLHSQCMVRVAQVYPSGCCIYIYFGFVPPSGVTVTEALHKVEDGVRHEIFKVGGSISHHHGVGKMRRKYYENSVSSTGVGLLQAVKDKVDPENVFAVENLYEGLSKNRDKAQSKL